MLKATHKKLIALMRESLDELDAALSAPPDPAIDYAKAADADVAKAAEKLYRQIARSPNGLSQSDLARKHPTWGVLRVAATTLLVNTNRIIVSVVRRADGIGRPATVYTINPNPNPNPKDSTNVNSST